MSRKREAARRGDLPDPAAFHQLMQDGCTVLRLHAATRLGMQAYAAVMAEVDLTMPQFATLASLCQQDGLSVTALAQLVGVDSTTLTRNLRLLEQRGLVVQDIAADDRRRRVLRLTADGRRLFARALPLWQKAQAALTRKLGAAQAAALHQQLGQTIEKLRN
ncbi:MAG: MarR family winged helix-turn-helix transcriptional regulator [Ferrovibrio sp.]